MSTDDAPPRVTFAIKKRKPPRASTSKLSFGAGGDDDAPTATPTSSAAAQDDEDERGSAVVIRSDRAKKTPAGRRVVPSSASTTTPSTSTKRGLLRPPPPPPPAAASTGASSIYSKEYLDQLKQDHSATPLKYPPPTTTSHADPAYDDLTLTKFGAAAASGEFLFLYSTDSSSTHIPTTNAIAHAKARREELRKTGLQDDYISLSSSSSASGTGTGTVGLYGHKSGESRLVREEDELGDGDDDLAAFTGADDRVALGRTANRAAASRLRDEMGDLIDDVEGDVSDDDDETKRWELAQIRRAAGPGAGGRKSEYGAPTTTTTAYRPTPIPQSTTVPSLSAVTARLAAQLSTLQQSHVLDQASLDHFVHERTQLDSQEDELRVEVARTEQKHRWFDEFRETAEDWAAFLDEKFPQLERIEKCYLDLQRERHDIIARRRLADDSDDVALFTGAKIATDRAELGSREEDPDDAMDGGRGGVDLAPRSIARNTRRAERQLRHAGAGASTSAYPDALTECGYGTDSSLSPTETSDLAAALADLSTSLAAVFTDVNVDDYRDPNLGIRRKFDEWRTLWREEYDAMFGALGMVGVWEFWARVEMSSWNPFEIEQLGQTRSDLSQYTWHQALSAYGHGAGDDQGEDDDDRDPVDESTEVVNAMVTSVVIPRLCALARAAYDPLSSRQTVAALKWVDEISYCVERDSPKFESLVQAFLFRLRAAIHTSQLLLVPYVDRLATPAIAYDPSTFVARDQFLARQWKLLRSCLRWRRMMKSLRVPVAIAGDDEVGLPAGGEGFDELVVRELVGVVMVPVIEASWTTGGEAIAQKVLDALPKDKPQTRRTTRSASVAPHEDDWTEFEAASSSASSSAPPAAVLLFAPSLSVSADEGDSDWTCAASSSTGSCSRSGASSLGLGIPHHDGDGVFNRPRPGVESLRGSDCSDPDRGSALTEAALSSLAHDGPTRPRLRHGVRHDDDELSAGFTSGSDDEVRHSVAALSAGIAQSRTPRAPARAASRSPALRNRLALAGSSIHRSVSPSSSGSTGQRLSRSKRRHRKAAGRAEEGGTSTSHKRFERIDEQERMRAERMKDVLAERLHENRVERAQNQIFMGELAVNVMNLDRSTFPLLASNTSDATPTPSRASSPPPSTAARLSRAARQQFSQISFDSIGQSYLESARLDDQDDDGDGDTTETERDASPRSRRSSAAALAPSEWVHSTSPPVFAPRSPPPPPSDLAAARSRRPRPSPSSSSSAALRPVAASSSTPRPRPSGGSSAALSEFSTARSLPFSLAPLSQQAPPSLQQQPLASPTTTAAMTSHEERVLLASSSTSTSTVPAAAAPWGGELDSSFELAVSVWKRFLRRLTRSSSSASSSNHQYFAASSPLMSPVPAQHRDQSRSWTRVESTGWSSGSQVSAY
ncbi:hypothetical protein JCM11491_000069 [Sporobolomyces phaffii]